MLKRIILSLIGCAVVLCGNSSALTVCSAESHISFESVMGESNQRYQGTTLSSPDEVPVNDKVKNLDGRIIKVMIDPGHFSYYNQSPVYSPYWESVMTWKLSNYLQQELQALGVHADLTKTSLDDNPGLNARGFSSKGYDFFISMHSNAMADSSADNPLALVYQDLPWTTIDDVSKDMGRLLSAKVSDVMGTSRKGTVEQRKGTEDHDKNGIMDDEWYSVLFASRYVGTPGILLEHSCHTNYKATLWLYNDNNLRTLAKEEAAVIYGYFSEIKAREYPEPEPVVIPSPQHELLPGDIDGDNLVDATDATYTLMEYACLSTGGEQLFNEYQLVSADVNGDGVIDASDTSLILAFYAYTSTGGEEKNLIKWYESR